MRNLRIYHFCHWASAIETVASYLGSLPSQDIRKSVSDPNNSELVAMALLDRDWHSENAKVFAEIQHESLAIKESFVLGLPGFVELIGKPAPKGEETWVIFIAHHPQKLVPHTPKLFKALKQLGYRIFLYAYDEASRYMPCFEEIAPHLDVLIHDENPLDPRGAGKLRPDCLVKHYSWVANLVPFSVPFNESPEEKIIFLGSGMGLTDHRKRQVEYLRDRFKDRFIASCDHSVSIAARGELNRYKASICPEGRKFGTPGMSQSHTDRPFWSGCMGLVPVSENSKQGNRLEELHRQKLILRYEHGDFKSLGDRCEEALALGLEERRRIYDHFNRNETVGTIVANAIAATRP